MNEQLQQVPPLEGFRETLQEKRYRQSTINKYIKDVGYFLKWLQSPSFGGSLQGNEQGSGEAENIEYKNLLEYVQYEQQRNQSVATINIRLGSITKYFDYLKQQGNITKNPATTLRIRGKTKTVIEYPLKYEELQQLYQEYKGLQKTSNNQRQTDLSHQRNIIITGLLIWQGLHSGELEKLEVNHINLSEGTIYIPSTSRSNSRVLPLHNLQILTLYSYIHGGTRDQLQPKGDESACAADRLFTGSMQAMFRFLLKELQGINPVIKNGLHIRASVILHWLKLHGKRQVQYMIGHRYIDSTERYAVQEMETLTDALTKYHPFG